STRDVTEGQAPQMPLEALIACVGGFEGVPAAAVSELAHWKLSGGEEPAEAKRLNIAIEDAIAQAEDGLNELIRAFDDPSNAYHAQPRATPPRFSDYGHLARVAEWSAGGGDGS